MGIPEIDIAGFLAGDAAAQRRVCGEVNDALRDIGFFTITGHGVAPELIAGMRNTAKAFFDLPARDKLRFRNQHAASAAVMSGWGRRISGGR